MFPLRPGSPGQPGAKPRQAGQAVAGLGAAKPTGGQGSRNARQLRRLGPHPAENEPGQGSDRPGPGNDRSISLLPPGLFPQGRGFGNTGPQKGRAEGFRGCPADVEKPEPARSFGAGPAQHRPASGPFLMKKRPIQSRPARDGAWGLALFCGLLLLNASLVSPYIGWYDSGEMVGATVCLGISHPSGQALFHLLGKLFLLFPFETPAYRLGFMSAAFSALASVFFWILACRLAERVTGAADHRLSPALKRWLALLTIAWSLSQPWWRYSLTPLVYALHLLLGLLLLWVLSLDKPGKWFLVFLSWGWPRFSGRPNSSRCLLWGWLFFGKGCDTGSIR